MGCVAEESSALEGVGGGAVQHARAHHEHHHGQQHCIQQHARTVHCMDASPRLQGPMNLHVELDEWEFRSAINEADIVVIRR